jgi:hypothetical protein
MRTDGNIVESWKARFRHSAGRIGGMCLRALRDEAGHLGWRINRTGKIHVPPKDLGESGQFVDVGPGAGLLTFARNVSFPADEGRCLCLGRVMPDGVTGPLCACVVFGGNAAPPGERLRA